MRTRQNTNERCVPLALPVMIGRALAEPVAHSKVWRSAWLAAACVMSLTLPLQAQEASINSSIGNDGTGKIVVEASGTLPEPAVFFTATINETAKAGTERVESTIDAVIKVVQGNAKTLSFGINGNGRITNVTGEKITSWSVRKEGDKRFLDINVGKDVAELAVQIKLQSEDYGLQEPVTIDLTHLTRGDAVGFSSTVSVNYAETVEGSVSEVNGFAPLDAVDGQQTFQSTTGGQLRLRLTRAGSAPGPVEMTDCELTGELHPNGDSIQFRLDGIANVTKANTEITILSGNAAVSKVPDDAGYRLRLTTDVNRTIYKLVFSEPGEFPVALDFVTKLTTADSNGRGVDFSVATSAVVPLKLRGLAAELEFHRDQESVVPLRNDDQWLGFLPATGRCKLQWKPTRKTGEGKLFFSTTGRIDSRIGTGLLRQDHLIEYKILQGELKSYRIALQGPGEILDVSGSNVVGWNVSNQGDNRLLEVSLSQPITGTSQLTIRSQTALDAFPVQVEGLRLNPEGALRYSGHLRITNLGSVRLEPTSLTGLTQLAPEQFPAAELGKVRQTFVYRFPAADYGFSVAADRIEPEVNISELVLYQLSETDRVIHADVELDVREAPIREWNFSIPSDYSVVSVTGARVADYVAATAVNDGQRNLKVILSQDTSGRQLVKLHLEKSEAAAAGNWDLPRLNYPDAKTVRGAIGIVGAPGFRIAVAQTDLLVEKPLSYFPKPAANLQQAFRIREPGWSARMTIELLDRSVQSDVFHLYSLSQETVYGSALINYFVTGAPVSEWRVSVPESLGNVMVDGQDIRTWRREADTLIVSLHQPVMGAYTLLVTFEEKPEQGSSSFQAGRILPTGVQSERGYIQVVSPMQVEIETTSISDDMLKLDPLELPAEFRLLSTAPPLGTWQYTDRPFDLNLKVSWFEPGTTVTQLVEFSEANSRVSQDGELVTDLLYYVKSRGRRTFRIKLPPEPVKLWAVKVNGQPVTARQAEDGTLIPLPGGTDPNIPIEVSLRLGKPTVDASRPELALPVVSTPVLKTQWNVAGDEHHVLVPGKGSVSPAVPVLRPSGFDWVARNGILSLLWIALGTGFGVWATRRGNFWRFVGLLSLAVAIGAAVDAASTAYEQIGSPAPLQMNLPVLAADEVVELHVSNTPLWQVNLSAGGGIVIIAGIALTGWAWRKREPENTDAEIQARSASEGNRRRSVRSLARRAGMGTDDDSQNRELARGLGILLVGLGVLLQGDGAAWFFGLLAAAILTLLFAWPFITGIRDLGKCIGRWFKGIAARRRERKAEKQKAAESEAGSTPGAVATSIIFMAFALSSASGKAAVPTGFEAADFIGQQWNISHQANRLNATGTVTVTGTPGDRFVLLKTPAVLTNFEGEGLRLTKRDIPGVGLAYVISIPLVNEDGSNKVKAKNYLATFEYQLAAVNPTKGISVLTGIAAVHEIDLTYDEPGWDVFGSTVARIEKVEDDTKVTRAKILLGPGDAQLSLKPKARDVASETTKFFVEASNLYLPGPGVVDGRHLLEIRPSQGQVRELIVAVPAGLTISSVDGPVGSWQFDADNSSLKLQLEPAQSKPFHVGIESQRGLDPLPADVTVAPLRVAAAEGEVGMVAVAFGDDAQPESVEANGMSTVNISDFSAGLLPNNQAVLHRVFRYGADGGELSLRVAPVAPEVRVVSKQVLSLGEERVVLGVNFSAGISRAGLFQLSFPLPDGLEVESLTGSALHHWAELSEGDERHIILHLNGKTLGVHTFALALAGPAPTDVAEWEIPRFELKEAARQSGEIVVRPTTGIRLRTVFRQNVSETDPRAMGANSQGALAFRLLQRDWNLKLGIEKLAPWVTGQVLHLVTLREGQTRSMLLADFRVQNASIRNLRVTLPVTDEDEIKTLRASGTTISDLVRTAPDSNTWEVQLKRRVVGKLQFRIEYERRGDRQDNAENLRPAEFPEARQLAYYFGVRAGGRLELDYDAPGSGWQNVDWNSVPQSLREAESRSTPALAFRTVAPAESLRVRATRHSLADSLKLRVAKGSLTTILSPNGDRLTAVDMVMEVIQRSSLSVTLPQGGDLFSVFVNGESVNSIRRGETSNAWQFHILPGLNDRTAQVRFVYSVAGNQLSRLNLNSPQLNVPLENIQWNVIAPRGYKLSDNDGNLELVNITSHEAYDRDSYLSKASSIRKNQARQAALLLEQANQLLQAGEQSKASWALNSVANQYALDAASNEDARIQLENLQTQQAIVGLNTIRQQLYLDNSGDDSSLPENEQLRQAAATNPVLQQDQLNFRPQELSQLLRGNTTEDNAVLQKIAARLVQHQRATEPAPQAIIISLPEEGDVYTFGRSVQVAENAPLELDLNFGSKLRLEWWRIGSVLILLTLLGTIFLRAWPSTQVASEAD